MGSKFKGVFREGKLQKSGFYFKLLFILSGIASTVWFLIRVIPKPSRATYPCMRTAAPIMSSFIIYLIALSGSMLAFKNSKRLIANKKYVAAFSLLIVGVATFFVSQSINPEETKAAVLDRSEIVPNDPIGVPYGIDPGKVVWVHNPDATNGTLKNSSGDYWWMDKNTDPAIVQKMLDDGVRSLAKQGTVKGAWAALFAFHDEKLGRANKGYTKGDKIFIKPNFTRSYNNSGGTYESDDRQDTSPQILLAILKQLINEAGVDQKDITLGDPFRNFRDNYYDMLDGAFPNVTWLDNHGGSGRVQTTLTSNKIYNTSDGDFSGRIPQAYADAKYFINVASLKVHDAAGITLCAKNHQGSVFNDENRSASIEVNLMMTLHYCYPNSGGENDEMKQYRHLTDYMGHKYMGGNTVINIIDGLWPGGQSVGEDAPVKYQMSPFNNDYPSSIFLSQDRVAIESVGYDFLLEEYSDGHTDKAREAVERKAVADYIEQAADPSNRPKGIQYDPEADGSKITKSMGVYEHWNNSNDKKYSRNLGIGNGILLHKIDKANPYDPATSIFKKNIPNTTLKAFPNPVVDNLNITYSLKIAGELSVDLINMQGEVLSKVHIGYREVGEYASSFTIPNELPQGNYICRLNNSTKDGLETQITRIIVQ